MDHGKAVVSEDEVRSAAQTSWDGSAIEKRIVDAGPPNRERN